MKKLLGKSLKQSLIVLSIVVIFVICSSLFGSISFMTKAINQAKECSEKSSNQISIGEEVDDVKGYADIVYGAATLFSYFSIAVLIIIRGMMQIAPILVFILVLFCNLIAWLFNLGKQAIWKKNVGIVFWLISMAKLLVILALSVVLVINTSFKFPFVSYGICILIITAGSMFWQIRLMCKNSKVIKEI